MLRFAQHDSAIFSQLRWPGPAARDRLPLWGCRLQAETSFELKTPGQPRSRTNPLIAAVDSRKPCAILETARVARGSRAFRWDVWFPH